CLSVEQVAARNAVPHRVQPGYAGLLQHHELPPAGAIRCSTVTTDGGANGPPASGAAHFLSFQRLQPTAATGTRASRNQPASSGFETPVSGTTGRSAQEVDGGGEEAGIRSPSARIAALPCASAFRGHVPVHQDRTPCDSGWLE